VVIHFANVARNDFARMILHYLSAKLSRPTDDE
jgi:hypothetical protein